MDETQLLLTKIDKARSKALGFIDSLRSTDGYKYTVNHDYQKEPSANLYGTWSAAYIKKLILGQSWNNQSEKDFIAKSLNIHRQRDGTFFPNELLQVKPSKSFDYLRLHCSNYATGALLEIDPYFDFQSSYFDKFTDASYLARWLEQRAFNRPWEESNNIVNVASYLQLLDKEGHPTAQDRLYQILEWHNKYQNEVTGGFDNFNSANYKNILESMAGAVHNFHIHLYLNEPMNFESKIARNVIPYLFEGPLTACLSIDFVELAIRTIDFSEDKTETISALLVHLNYLLDYQNPDGGWYENESAKKPTVAAGMRESIASSCSYSTWFRLCSIGMIAIALLNDPPNKWTFRKSLGMGYAPDFWPDSYRGNSISIDNNIRRYYERKNLPKKLKKQIVNLGVKILK